jgi:phosphoglycerate dehydrogenase-like enzyme
VNRLRIFVDIEMPPDARELLHAGTATHELIFSRTPATSILTVAERDSEFATADVAFGQPDPQAIAGAGRLRWVHVSSAGITRYDHPEFRALVARREIPVTNSSSVFAAPCAVHALSFMLAQTRQLPLALKSRSAWASHPWLALRAASGT